MTQTDLSHMPPRAPLAMPEQDLRRAPGARPCAQDGFGWRLAVFAPALIITGLLLWGLHGVLAQAGMSFVEWALLAMIGMTFVWVSLAVSTVGVALVGRFEARVPARSGAPIDVALLVPVYNEVTWDVFGNAAAMLNDVAARNPMHRYSLFILSDTQNPDIAQRELQAFEVLRRGAPEGMAVHYRRRAQNVDKKVGNLADWITGWGAAHDAMLVLDADSLMTGRAIVRLSDEMAADPQAGLIQSFPQLIGAETVFARIQQFSNMAYGWLLAEGLARWARAEGNYWGHNAIIRVEAFASAAGLPHIRGGRDLILSHDFVEASLLRRAGWTVKFLPRVAGSFEETPGTLVDYVLRDRRWCRGNLQHLRLLGTKGLHPVSRFHLFQGAMAYLMSPAWFVLLVFWTLLGKDAETNVIRYFNEANPLFPSWPPEMSHIDSAAFLVIMYAMLLTPKVTSALVIALRPGAVRMFGGKRAFGTAFLTEVALSVAYAPILMIQQTKAVLRALLSRRESWAPQNREGTRQPLLVLLKFHWVETALGVLLTVGLIAGLISWWLVPIIASLLLAVPLSALSSLNLARHAPAGLRMDSPLTLHEPAIVGHARVLRAALRADLEGRGTLAAE